MTKMKMNPQHEQHAASCIYTRPLHIVASQQKICTPLGIAIIMLAP